MAASDNDFEKSARKKISGTWSNLHPLLFFIMMLCKWTHKMKLTIILHKKRIGILESKSKVGDVRLSDYGIKKNNYNLASKGDLDCEDVIMNEKERFGRVRTSMMKTLRKQYGRETADRALSRINKRFSEGSLRIKNHLQQPKYSI